MASAAARRRLDLRHERLDAIGDGDAVLVELVLPQEAVHQRALQLHLGREAPGRVAPSWVKARKILLSLTMMASSG